MTQRCRRIERAAVRYLGRVKVRVRDIVNLEEALRGADGELEALRRRHRLDAVRAEAVLDARDLRHAVHRLATRRRADANLDKAARHHPLKKRLVDPLLELAPREADALEVADWRGRLLQRRLRRRRLLGLATLALAHAAALPPRPRQVIELALLRIGVVVIVVDQAAVVVRVGRRRRLLLLAPPVGRRLLTLLPLQRKLGHTCLLDVAGGGRSARLILPAGGLLRRLRVARLGADLQHLDAPLLAVVTVGQDHLALQIRLAKQLRLVRRTLVQVLIVLIGRVVVGASRRVAVVD